MSWFVGFYVRNMDPSNGVLHMLLQWRDQRGGALRKHFDQVSILQVTISISEEQDIALAEAALQAFASKLLPLIELGPAH
jgi:hypothetical protein